MFGALRRQSLQASLDVASTTPCSRFQLFLELHPYMAVVDSGSSWLIDKGSEL